MALLFRIEFDYPEYKIWHVILKWIFFYLAENAFGKGASWIFVTDKIEYYVGKGENAAY